MKCFSCGNNLPDDSKFCQYCGTDLTQGHYCPKCGAVMREEMNFCPKCGHQMNRAQWEEIASSAGLAEPDVTESVPEPEKEKSGETTSVDYAPDSQAIPAQANEAVTSSTITTESPPVRAQKDTTTKKKNVWFPLVTVGLIVTLIVGFLAAGDKNSQVMTPAQAAENVLYLEVYDSTDVCIGSGSGFLIGDAVTLVTNYHVIEDAYHMIAMTADGEHTVKVDTVLAYDKAADLAILKCSEKIGVDSLALADSDQVKQGDVVYAAGYPLGIANTLSDGIVSSRYIDENGVDILQITAPISGGSSGGALLNETGQVVGVVCAYYIDGQNMNIAIAANTIDSVLNENRNIQSLTGLYLNNHPPVKSEEFQPITPIIPPAKEPEPKDPICNHEYGAWNVTKESTCQEKGKKVRACTLCGAQQMERTPTVDHSKVIDNAVAATCISEGKTEGSHCSVCGKVLTAQSTIPMTEHTYSNGYCSGCGSADPNYKIISAADLQGTWKETWTNKGYSGYRSYTFSGNSFRWEQRAAGADSVLQVQTGTYSIDGMIIYFVPNSYTEDGVAIDYFMDPNSRTIMEIGTNKLVLSPGFHLIKQ